MLEYAWEWDLMVSFPSQTLEPSLTVDAFLSTYTCVHVVHLFCLSLESLYANDDSCMHTEPETQNCSITACIMYCNITDINLHKIAISDPDTESSLVWLRLEKY